jgi:hypothetical protein
VLTVWESYFDMLAEAYSTRIPQCSNAGNHELQALAAGLTFIGGPDDGGEGGAALQALAPLPEPATPRAAWYSFNMGLVHVVGLSTEQPFWEGTPQHTWLAADLAAVNRSVTPWVVLAGHRPAYISSTDTARASGDGNISALMRAHLEPLMWAGRVNLALYGHNHAVQRMSAAYAGRVVQASVPATLDGQPGRLQADPQATVHYVVGNGGAGFTRDQQQPPPEWCEWVTYQFGLGLLTVHNASHLQWRVLEGEGGSVIDNLWIVRPNQTAAWVLPPVGPTGGGGGGGGGGSSAARVSAAVAGSVAVLGVLAAAGYYVWNRRRAGAGGGGGAGGGQRRGSLRMALYTSLSVRLDNPAAAAAAAAALTTPAGGGAPPPVAWGGTEAPGPT